MQITKHEGVIFIGIHTFFTSLGDLERIIRCPGRFKFEEHNVAAHSWKVSQYAMFFATLEELNGAEINWKSLYEKTINHDFAEVFIGDIKTPVKHASVELKQMLAHVEEKMMEKFILEEIPPSLQSIFFERMKEGKDATMEGRLLEFADKLDQFYESFAELKRGNTDKEFVYMYQTALTKLLLIPLPVSIDYFRNEILRDAVAEETQINIEILTEQVLQQLKKP
ncbi:YfbR-like 5'-deoxynucleotidase [Solibacillus sp. FSL H8-0538]|uniref:YfbR-like 5'-deoxynucleotidase n=1 Tax=Solibacillus sp. FSL H8-0538 TaxID=2921400 RepID=UPI0030FCCE4F